MTDFDTPVAPAEAGHAGALPPPDSAPVEQPASDSSFDTMMDKAAARMAGDQPQAPAPQDKPEAAQAAEPAAPPPVENKEEPKHKIKVGGEEREVTQSELMELASKGADYTRKTQELARERDRIAALDALAKRLESDSGFRDHVFGYGQSQATPAQQFPQDRPPADPVERLRWEAVQQAKAEVMREMAPLMEQIPALQAMQRIEATKATIRQDPAASQVIEAMQAYVKAQPAPFRDRIFQELDTNPDAFMNVYADFRERLNSMAAKRAPATPPPAAPQQPKTAPPPTLESSGNVAAARTGDEASIRSLRKQLKDGTAGPDALKKMLEYSGAFKRMGA